MDNRAYGSSWKDTALGTLPFALWGIALITLELPHEWAIPVWMTAGLMFLFFAILLVPPIVLGIGWIKGFPRWSYPYLTMSIAFSLFLTNASTPGMNLLGYPTFGRELWGWRAWIPLLIVAALSLSISRSLRPVLKLIGNAWNDLTLITFGLFGLTPLLVAMFFDEIDRQYSLFFMIAFTLVAVATALIYLRAQRSLIRTSVLTVGIVCAVAILVIGPNAYWQSHGGMNPIPSIVAGFVLLLLMILPSLINHMRQLNRTLDQTGT